MSFENRGGFPTVFSATIDTTGQRHALPAISKHLRIRNTGGTNDLRVFFTQADFDADANFVTVDANVATDSEDVLEGPFEVKEIWFKAAAGSTTVEMIEFNRRG